MALFYGSFIVCPGCCQHYPCSWNSSVICRKKAGERSGWGMWRKRRKIGSVDFCSSAFSYSKFIANISLVFVQKQASFCCILELRHILLSCQECLGFWLKQTEGYTQCYQILPFLFFYSKLNDLFYQDRRVRKMWS